jgi:hypothetical protein
MHDHPTSLCICCVYIIVPAIGALAVSGCTRTAAYSHANKKPPAAAISDPQIWRLGGNLYNLGHAADGSTSTATVSDPAYRNATLTIDLGKPCLFNAIFIDHGPSAMGFCRRVAVLTSLDGKHFSQQHVGPGTRRVTSLCIIKPVLARYIRLQAIIPGDRAWSIGEVYIQ